MKSFEERRRALLENPETRQEMEINTRALISTSNLLNQLDQLREEQGLTKKELANLAGIEPASVRRLLSGQSPNPTLNTVMKLLAALDSSLSIQH